MIDGDDVVVDAEPNVVVWKSDGWDLGAIVTSSNFDLTSGL